MSTFVILMLIPTIFLLILLLLVFYWYYIFLSYKRHLRYPTISKMPLFGISSHFRTTTDFYNRMLSYHKAFGKNTFEMIGFYPILWTSDPEIFAKVLGSPKYVDKPEFYDVMKNSVGGTLSMINGDEWRQQRKLFNPLFQGTKIWQHLDFFNKQSDELINMLFSKANKGAVDLCDPIQHFVFNQAYARIFGNSIDPKALPLLVRTVQDLTKIAVERMLRPNEYFNFTYVFSRNFWRERKLIKFAMPYVKDALLTAQIAIEKNPDKKEELKLIDLLLKEMKNNKTCSLDIITRQLTLMIVAEFETTALAICYIIYHLSIFPDIQQKAYEEVTSILGNNKNQYLTHQHLDEMKYLELVIKESMRLKPSIPMIARILKEDVELNGSILPKGLIIAFFIYVMQVDPEIYPEPEKFIPERFLPENVNSNRYSFAPFSGGVRNCIGQKQAMLFLKITIAKLLLNYKLVDAQHQLILANEIVLHSTTGIKVIISKRYENKS